MTKGSNAQCSMLSMEELQDVVSRGNLPDNCAGYTVLSGYADGSFIRCRGVREAGNFVHVIVQTDEQNRPLLRAYKSEYGKHRTIPVVGGHASNNIMAFDLTGKTGGQIAPTNTSLIDAAVRCIDTLHDGRNPVHASEAVGPRFWAVYPEELLSAACVCPALEELANALVLDRLVLQSIVSPITGEVVSHIPYTDTEVDDLEPAFEKLVISNGSKTCEIVVPVAHAHVTHVTAYTPFVVLTPEVDWNVALEVAWFEAQAGAPPVDKGQRAIRATCAYGLISAGQTPIRMLEDIRHMLSTTVNYAAHVRRDLSLPLDQYPEFYKLPITLQNHVSHAMRHYMQEAAQFVLPRDLAYAFDNPEKPVVSYRIVSPQIWPVNEAADLTFRYDGIRCDFRALRSVWFNVFGNTDPRKRTLPLETEQTVLQMAVAKAKDALAHPTQSVFMAAAEVLLAATKTDTFTNLLGTLQLITEPKDVVDYLEDYCGQREADLAAASV